jgi:hypothetical protein
VYKICLGKDEEQRPLGRIRGRWDDYNNKTDFNEFETVN